MTAYPPPSRHPEQTRRESVEVDFLMIPSIEIGDHFRGAPDDGRRGFLFPILDTRLSADGVGRVGQNQIDARRFERRHDFEAIGQMDHSPSTLILLP